MNIKLLSSLILLTAISTPAALPEVHSFGSLRAIMQEGKTAAVVDLSSIVPGQHVYGVGALSGLRGEVTILDDILWLAYPAEKSGGVRITRTLTTTESAALLVSAKVEAWRSIKIEASIPADKLDDFVEQSAKSNGIDTEKPFPFLIKGKLSALGWHALNSSDISPNPLTHGSMISATRGVSANIEATLVGFFSKHHAGVFTHMGSRTHLHVLTNDETLSAHVDSVDVSSDCSIWLPK